MYHPFDIHINVWHIWPFLCDVNLKIVIVRYKESEITKLPLPHQQWYKVCTTDRVSTYHFSINIENFKWHLKILFDSPFFPILLNLGLGKYLVWNNTFLRKNCDYGLSQIRNNMSFSHFTLNITLSCILLLLHHVEEETVCVEGGVVGCGTFIFSCFAGWGGGSLVLEITCPSTL